MAALNIESARVVATSKGALWVDTIQRSTCNSCSSRAGCGQYTLNKLQLHRQSHLKVPIDPSLEGRFVVGDFVKIGVPQGLVLKFALVVYILPLMAMIAGALLADNHFGTDLAAGVGGVVGLVAGFLGVRLYSNAASVKKDSHPVLIITEAEKNCFIPAENVELLN